LARIVPVVRELDTAEPPFVHGGAWERGGILVSGKGGGLSGQVKDAPDPMEALDRFFVGAQAQAQLALKAAHAPGEFDHEQAVALETGGTFLRKNPPPPAAILSLEKASGS